jgi:hypothetical protein
MSTKGFQPEDVYQVFHQETNLASGRRVRRVKNFSNAQSKPTWVHFIRCADWINRNRGQVDLQLYMKALADYYEGWFDPKALGGIKATRIYKTYIKDMDEQSTPEYMRQSLLRSIKFVANYCKSSELDDLSDYLSEDLNMIPTVLRHYNAKSVSMYFLAAMGDFREYAAAYPKDAVTDYIPDLEDDYPVYRMRILHNPDLKKIATNIEQLTNQLILQ